MVRRRDFETMYKIKFSNRHRRTDILTRFHPRQGLKVFQDCQVFHINRHRWTGIPARGRPQLNVKECSAPRRFHMAGFTLMETIIVVAVIALMATVAVPSFFNLLPDYRLRSAAREMISCFQEMKMTAIAENTHVVAVFNLTSGTYVAFIDNGDGGGVKHDDLQNGTEPVLKSGGMPTSVSMTGTTFLSNSSGYIVGFNGRGLLIDIGGEPTDGELTLGNTNGNVRTIRINSAGSILVE